MKFPEQDVISLWYQGIGALFRDSRGSGGRLGTHDSPRTRLFIYCVAGGLLGFMAALLAVFGWGIIGGGLVWLFPVCLLVALGAVFTSIRVLRSAGSLNQALKNGQDTDLNDPLRMAVMKKACRWAYKKGYIQRELATRWKIIMK